MLGSNTYTGGTTISAGTLQVGNGGSGAAIGTAQPARQWQPGFQPGRDNPTFSGVISGSGSLTQAGTGVLTLLGSNTYTRRHDDLRPARCRWATAAAALRSAAPAACWTMAASFSTTATATTFSGVISGSGNLTQTGTGILTLLGSNTYTGSTTVSGGTLQVGNGGSGESLGSSSVSLSNSTALVFNQSRRADLQRQHQRHRQPDADRHGHADAGGQQHLHGRHDRLWPARCRWATAAAASSWAAPASA